MTPGGLEILGLRVVFPLTEPRKPTGRESPKNGEKLQNSPPRSNPWKWGKITENHKKYSENTFFGNFSVIFPHFRGLDQGGGFCNFSPFFGDCRPGGFRGSVRGKTTRNTWIRKLRAELSFPIPTFFWAFFFPSLLSVHATPPQAILFHRELAGAGFWGWVWKGLPHRKRRNFLSEWRAE